jgi:outer membrane biosynthesis protein TonB
MIRFPCPQCKATLKAAAEKQGAKVKCGQCNHSARVPSSAPEQGVTVPPAALPRRKAAPARAPLYQRPAVVGGLCVGLCLVVLITLVSVAAYAVSRGKKPAPAAVAANNEGGPSAPVRDGSAEEKPKELAPTPEGPKTLPRQPKRPVVEPAPVEKPSGPDAPVEKKPPEPTPEPEPKKDPPPAKAPEPVTVAKEKPLSKNVQAGLDYLARSQMQNGAWAEGVENENPNNPAGRLPSVAHTSLAGLAFLRAGGSPGKGDHAKRLTLAVEFVCAAVEKADKDSLSLGGGANTYIRTKLGKYIDTYLALWFLAEVKGQMADEKANQRVDKALAKVIDKMQRHQLPDGSWDSVGVSPGVANGIATKGLFRARQVGADVDKAVLAKAEKRGRDYFEKVTTVLPAPGTFFPSPPPKPGDKPKTEPGTKPVVGVTPGPGFQPGFVVGTLPEGFGVGIDLYSLTSNLSALQEATSAARQAEVEARHIAESPGASESEKAAARELAERVATADKAHREAVETVSKHVNNEAFLMTLVGCGGEEFFGVEIVSESLRSAGHADWDKWDKFVTTGLNKSQNRDGSWSGGHCLTGRTFCTATALLALTADRAPIGSAAK